MVEALQNDPRQEPIKLFQKEANRFRQFCCFLFHIWVCPLANTADDETLVVLAEFDTDVVRAVPQCLLFVVAQRCCRDTTHSFTVDFIDLALRKLHEITTRHDVAPPPLPPREVEEEEVCACVPARLPMPARLSA